VCADLKQGAGTGRERAEEQHAQAGAAPDDRTGTADAADGRGPDEEADDGPDTGGGGSEVGIGAEDRDREQPSHYCARLLGVGNAPIKPESGDRE
jgi:hypothetical protein